MAKKGDKVGLFPGTFDPITNGHMDVLVRGQALFNRLIIAIGRNPAKRELFTLQERCDMTRALVAESCDPHVEVQTYEGLTVDFARSVGATVILRGLRNVTDLNFEFQLALTNRAIAGIETIFIMTGESHAFTSSSLIKEIASAGHIDRLERLLPNLVIERLKEKQRLNNGKLPWHSDDGLKE